MKKDLLITAAVLIVVIICIVLFRYGKKEGQTMRRQMEEKRINR
jgi:hypothetical protein